MRFERSLMTITFWHVSAISTIRLYTYFFHAFSLRKFGQETSHWHRIVVIKVLIKYAKCRKRRVPNNRVINIVWLARLNKYVCGTRSITNFYEGMHLHKYIRSINKQHRDVRRMRSVANRRRDAFASTTGDCEAWNRPRSPDLGQFQILWREKHTSKTSRRILQSHDAFRARLSIWTGRETRTFSIVSLAWTWIIATLPFRRTVFLYPFYKHYIPINVKSTWNFCCEHDELLRYIRHDSTLRSEQLFDQSLSWKSKVSTIKDTTYYVEWDRFEA